MSRSKAQRPTWSDEETEAIVRAECEAQGVPFTVEDPVVLARIGRILYGNEPAVGERAS